MAFQHDLLFLRFFNITVFSVSEKIIDLYQSLTFLVVFTLLFTLRESIEVLDGKKQKLDCIFEQ